MYLIVVCPKCGKLVIANSTQKTRTCPYCQKKITVLKAVRVVEVKTAREASIVIRKLKRKSV